jgi:hypothetical protein
VKITMKAKSISSFLPGLFLLALAACVAPRVASAQANEVVKFTLSAEVHWGEVVLPPGAYTVSLDSLSPATMVCVSKEGNPKSAYFIPAQVRESIPSTSQATRLIIEQKNGAAYVRELQLGIAGLALYYTEPKLKKDRS